MATHHIASVAHHSLAIGENNPRHGHLRIFTEYVCGGAVHEEGPHEGVTPGNKHTPARGAIQARYGFDDAIEGERMHLKAAEGLGREHAKETGLGQCRDHWPGEAAIVLGLVGMRPNQGRELVHSVE
jgi:hypothetical protein